MTKLIIGEDNEKMMALSGDAHVGYMTLLNQQRTIKNESNVEQVQLCNGFEALVVNEIASAKGYDLLRSAKHFSSHSLIKHLTESTSSMINLAKETIMAGGKPTDVAIEFDKISRKTQLVKDFALNELEPLLVKEYEQQQKNAADQPKPKNLSP